MICDEDYLMMPNRYIPSALTDMIDERHEKLIRERQGKGASDYIAEYEALVLMLKPEYQEEFRKRREGT